jgi:hypothetical protein
VTFTAPARERMKAMVALPRLYGRRLRPDRTSLPMHFGLDDTFLWLTPRRIAFSFLTTLASSRAIALLWLIPGTQAAALAVLSLLAGQFACHRPMARLV